MCMYNYIKWIYLNDLHMPYICSLLSEFCRLWWTKPAPHLWVPEEGHSSRHLHLLPRSDTAEMGCHLKPAFSLPELPDKMQEMQVENPWNPWYLSNMLVFVEHPWYLASCDAILEAIVPHVQTAMENSNKQISSWTIPICGRSIKAGNVHCYICWKVFNLDSIPSAFLHIGKQYSIDAVTSWLLVHRGIQEKEAPGFHQRWSSVVPKGCKSKDQCVYSLSYTYTVYIIYIYIYLFIIIHNYSYNIIWYCIIQYYTYMIINYYNPATNM